ncbi:hypothetical protein [Candidatus Mycobacterium methanotrophicum]|uniref:Uracil-DNA glycosylase-like domain-containing protein n=1 Tax=Candidatus Mycobacterium methanotrophicum TaxID=2943498 RepID=A0ABY4QGK1_9MYCO|nr:hypothetical protein [Candidatus Mycobacterium methanotrophicum]UQX10093.1 hypothetical protein M5I08_18020 [Candidatus Mycobacterium methanotrophicum]
MLGNAFRVSTHRGELLQLPPEMHVRLDPRPRLTATVHPSAVLRDRTDRELAYKSLVADLRSARKGLATSTR